MAQFPSNPTRIDPYKNFKFRLKLNGQVVAAASTATGLPHLAPADAASTLGRDKYEPITLESGVTHDSGFQTWSGSTSPGVKLGDLVLESHHGPQPIAWRLHNATIAELHSNPDPATPGAHIIHRVILHPESITPVTS
jgi:hypothetical protein